MRTPWCTHVLSCCAINHPDFSGAQQGRVRVHGSVGDWVQLSLGGSPVVAERWRPGLRLPKGLAGPTSRLSLQQVLLGAGRRELGRQVTPAFPWPGRGLGCLAHRGGAPRGSVPRASGSRGSGKDPEYFLGPRPRGPTGPSPPLTFG